MEAQQLCRNYLTIIDSMPQPVTWTVISVDRHVLVVDARDEATTMIMEAVAERFGEIIAMESIPSQRRNAGPLLGCLIRIGDGDADEIAGRVRAVYWTATVAEQPEGGEPF